MALNYSVHVAVLAQILQRSVQLIWSYENAFPFILGAFVLLSTMFRFWMSPVVFKREHTSLKSTRSPSMLPYRVPFVGHTIWLFMDSERLFSYGREFFGNTREIFSIKLFNKTIQIITNPHHIAIIHSKPVTFEFTGLLKSALIALGASKNGSNRLWNPRIISGAPTKGVIPLSHEYQIRQTSGAELKVLSQHICSFLVDRSSPETLATAHTSMNSMKCLSIMDWTRENIIHALQDAYFGPKLNEIYSSLPRAMMDFSELAWQAWYQVPWFMRRKQIKLCTRLLASYRRYVNIPPEEKKSTAWFTPMFEKDFQKVLTDETDKAALMMLFHWGIAMNPSDAAGWLVAHVIKDKDLMQAIRKETAPAFSEDGSIDTYFLANSCPVLSSVWYEVLRVYTSVTTMRNVTEDSTIGNTFIKKGSMLMFSARQLALDETVFPDPTKFDHTRFLRDNKLQRSESFRPFGGGKTICPGRHLAMHIATALVAILVRRYKISPSFPQDFPLPFQGEASIGIMRTKTPFYVKLIERV